MDFRNVVVTLTISLLLLTSGCNTHSIPSHFSPLDEIIERPFGGDGFVTTFHNDVWVNDIDDFLKRKPVGSPEFNATMIHERVHSIRMGNPITTLWFVAVYVFDRDFMWEEESIGWYFQLQYMKKKGILSPPEVIAVVLTRYENLIGKMISYNDALQWVRDVLTDKWKPDLTAEEWELYSPPEETD